MKKFSLKRHTHASKKQTKLTQEEREEREYEEFLRLKEKFESEEYEDEEYDDDEYEESYESEDDEHEVDELAEVEEEPEEELSEEELALYEAAEAYYEAGCDGDCYNCEHYDYCPAEEEIDPDDVQVIAGMTKGDIKKTAQSGVYLARESAMAAKEMKEAMDDIMGGLDVKNWFK